MFKPRSEQICDFAQKFATPFCTSLGDPWAIVPDGSGGYRGWPILSPGFQQWLRLSFNDKHSIVPSVSALESAARMFAARALHSDFPVGEVFTRVGWRGDRRLPESILLYLANVHDDLLEISSSGYNFADFECLRFLTGSHTMPLPRPIYNRTTLRSHLHSVLNLDGAALDRAIIWLFSALRPGGPYPALVVSGPPASGKTMLALMLRYLIDPSANPFPILPANEQHLVNLALHNHVLAFDHAAALPRTIAESLARVATGVGFGVCGRNIFGALEPLPLARPIIITSSGNDPLAPFSDVTIRIDLAARNPEDVRTEKSLGQKYLGAVPKIFGTLCAAVTAALSNTTAAQTPPVSRFPETRQWAVAAAPILGLTAEQIDLALTADPMVEQSPDVTFRKAHT